MLNEYKMQSRLGIWGGVFCFFIGRLIASSLTPPGTANTFFGVAIMAGSTLLFISGCFMYAKGKGHAWPFGLFGLLGPLGLLVLYVLKDRSKIVLKERAKERSRTS
ncbi:MAG: hypothetical protein V1863_05140 [Candidatus Omnitrophota bacterium]